MGFVAGALALAACSNIPDVTWDVEHCSVSEPADTSCEASMIAGEGHEAFRITLNPDISLSPPFNVVFTGSNGDIADGDHEISEESYDDSEQTAPGLLFDLTGGSGTIRVVSFDFVGMPHEEAGPLGFGRINAERGTFSVELDLTEYEPSSANDLGARVVANGEYLPQANVPGSAVSCTDRQNTGACTQFDLSQYSGDDWESRAAEVRISCDDGSDGDGLEFAPRPCVEGIARCTGATGTLESSQEQVPLEVVWYPEACQLGITTENMRSTCLNSLGGNFSGQCAQP